MRIERDQLILMASMAGMAAVFCVAAYMPMRDQQKQSLAQIQACKAQLAIDLAGAGDLARLESEVQALREANSGAQRGVPTQSELKSLLLALSSELDSRQVTDKETQMRAIMHGADYNVQPVSLRFKASFPAVYGFLRRIESMPRLIRIDRLELNTTPDGGGKLNARIELSTFFTDGEAIGS
jgi:Tfp pilus assembly protein PilO